MLENLYPAERAQDMMDKHLNIQSQNNGSVWVEDSLNTGRIFSGRLTYDKGAAIIHTLRFLINNDSLFFAALKQYQIQYANSTALGVDFIQVVEDVTGQDFTNFMQEWYFGEGHPIYSVRWNSVGSDVLIEINQQGATPAVTPFFTNDLELRFDRTGIADTNMRFTITGTQNQFIISNPGNISNILSIDPNNWICNGDFGISKDPNFVSVGLNELEDENPLTIYPNPTNGPLTVEMNSVGKYILTVVDNRGKVVSTQAFSQTTSVDLSAAAQGTYLIQVTSSESDLKLRRLVN